MFSKKIKKNFLEKSFVFAFSSMLSYKLFEKFKKENTVYSRRDYLNKKIIYSKSGGDEDEEKITNIKSINSRLSRIEDKLNYLLDKEKKDEIIQKDIPLYYLNSPKSSILSKVLTEKIWKKLYTQITEEGFTLNDLIQPGIDNPDHPTGLVAHSKDCYFTFDELLIQAAQVLHKRNLYLTKYEKENFPVLLNLINNMDNFLANVIYSVNIETNRNMDNYLFSGRIKRNERREISNKIHQIIEKIEKEIYENSEERGGFIYLDSNKISKEKLKENLKNRNTFFASCGFYRDFPEGRMIYHNKNHSISILTNVEDHLRFVLNSEQNNENKKFEIEKLIDYFEFISKVSENVSFNFDNNLGFVNSLIENLGSGSNFTVTLKVPVENKNKFLENIKANKELNVIDKGNFDESFALIELTNYSSFYNFTSFLLELINSREILDYKK